MSGWCRIPETSGGAPVSDLLPSPNNLHEIAEAIAAALQRRIDPAAARSSPLLTVRETCGYLNCARSTLYRLEAGGRLVPKRFGRKVLYDRAEVDAYIKQAGSV